MWPKNKTCRRKATDGHMNDTSPKTLYTDPDILDYDVSGSLLNTEK